MTSHKKQVYHLRYLELRARGEPVRWTLQVLGIEHTEERILVKDWQKIKPEFEWKKAPTLIVNESQLYQTAVICRYLAECHNMAPTDPWESAKLQEVAESINDVASNAGDTFYYRMMKQEDRMKLALENWRSRADIVAEVINKHITDEGWIRSKQMTYVDVFVAAYMDYFEEYFEDIYENVPKLLKLVNSVRSIPAIKAWLKIRPPLCHFESVDGLKIK